MMGRPLRICILALKYPPHIGGAERRAEKQARELQALGHQVTVLTLHLWKQWPRRDTGDGPPVVRVGGIYRRGGALRIGRLGIWFVNLGVLRELWRWRRRYDVIHVMQSSPVAAMAALAGRWAAKPVIISIQSTGPSAEQRARLEREPQLMADTLATDPSLGFDPAEVMAGDLAHMARSALAGAVLSRVLRESDVAYQILSSRSRAYLTSHGFRPERIVQITGSVDTQRFRPDPGRHPDRPRPGRAMICVARLDYEKGVDVLLHAWGHMLRPPADWRAGLAPRLRLVGDGALRPQLERIAAELGIADSVEFLGLRTDIVDLLQQSWGFVLPSRWEGMPNALLEAMACGLPCIATRVSGSEDIISDGVDGLLVEPEQPAALALALRRVVGDPELARRLGAAGRTKVVRDYQLRHVVEQCVALYRRLLVGNRGALAAPGRGISG